MQCLVPFSSFAIIQLTERERERERERKREREIERERDRERESAGCFIVCVFFVACVYLFSMCPLKVTVGWSTL